MTLALIGAGLLLIGLLGITTGAAFASMNWLLVLTVILDGPAVIVLGVLAIVFGGIGISRGRTAGGDGRAIAGMVIGIVVIALPLIARIVTL